MERYGSGKVYWSLWDSMHSPPSGSGSHWHRGGMTGSFQLVSNHSRMLLSIPPMPHALWFQKGTSSLWVAADPMRGHWLSKYNKRMKQYLCGSEPIVNCVVSVVVVVVFVVVVVVVAFVVHLRMWRTCSAFWVLTSTLFKEVHWFWLGDLWHVFPLSIICSSSLLSWNSLVLSLPSSL